MTLDKENLPLKNDFKNSSRVADWIGQNVNSTAHN